MVLSPTRPRRIDPSGVALTERVVSTRRVSKVVAGGRHMRFNALIVIGDGNGVVGAGLGKAEAIPDAVRKGVAAARKELVRVHMRGDTITHEVTGFFGAAQVLLKPAPTGTGVIAAGGVRAVLELAGVKNVVTKSLGSRNPINVVRATLSALRQLKDPVVEIQKRQNVKAPATATGKGA